MKDGIGKRLGRAEVIASKNLPGSNASGVCDVYFNKKRGKWVAQIMLRGKCYYLGAYSHIEDAAKARTRGEEMFDDFLAKYAQTYTLVEAAQVDVPNDLQAPKLPDGMTETIKPLGVTGMKIYRKLWQEYQQADREQVRHYADGEYEVCVLCGAMTNAPRSTPIELRSDYLLGAGQLCHKCAYDIQLRKKGKI